MLKSQSLPFRTYPEQLLEPTQKLQVVHLNLKNVYALSTYDLRMKGCKHYLRRLLVRF
jgi:hypothetical protein